MFFFFPLAMIVIVFCIFWIAASWTADEVGYVLSLLVRHHVELTAFEGFIVNIVFNAFIFSFDICVWLLRSVCAI